MNGYEFMIKMRDYASSGLRKVAESVGAVDKRIDNVDKNANRLGKTFGGLKSIMATAFAAIGIGALVSQTIDARQEYEKFEAVLTNTFQSAEVGQGALNMLTDFASKTPFQVNELTSSFIQLVNRGFNPAQDEMTKMGDLASSQGKSFGQLTEAILDAETNEFERLKEFGIKTKKVGSQVEMTFKGVTQTVDANGTSIRKAILEYGGMKGVAGSMEAVSKTLGGRLSNLKDQFWSLLVTIGGESSGVFSGFIDGLSGAIAFLSGHVAHISIWFRELWSILTPIGLSFMKLIQAVTGFTSAGDALSGFGDISVVVLQVLDVLSVGIVTIIDWLIPFSDLIGVVTIAWVGLSLAFAVSPIGWVVIGIMALIGAIGLVMKYTSGWKDNFKITTDGMKLLMEAFVMSFTFRFKQGVNGLMLGIDMIKKGWYGFKEAVGLGDSSENKKILNEINTSIENRKKAFVDGVKDVAKKYKEAANSFGITIDTNAMKDDFNALKNKFSNLGQKDKSAKSYLDWRGNQQKKTFGGTNAAKGTKGKKDMIVSGGSKQTHVTVHIGKLQDKTEIHVSNSEKGINNLGEKVREELLRAVNSVNQMQTG